MNLKNYGSTFIEAFLVNKMKIMICSRRREIKEEKKGEEHSWRNSKIWEIGESRKLKKAIKEEEITTTIKGLKEEEDFQKDS